MLGLLNNMVSSCFVITNAALKIIIFYRNLWQNFLDVKRCMDISRVKIYSVTVSDLLDFSKCFCQVEKAALLRMAPAMSALCDQADWAGSADVLAFAVSMASASEWSRLGVTLWRLRSRLHMYCLRHLMPPAARSTNTAFALEQSSGTPTHYYTHMHSACITSELK